MKTCTIKICGIPKNSNFLSDIRVLDTTVIKLNGKFFENLLPEYKTNIVKNEVANIPVIMDFITGKTSGWDIVDYGFIHATPDLITEIHKYLGDTIDALELKDNPADYEEMLTFTEVLNGLQIIQLKNPDGYRAWTLMFKIETDTSLGAPSKPVHKTVEEKIREYTDRRINDLIGPDSVINFKQIALMNRLMDTICNDENCGICKYDDDMTYYFPQDEVDVTAIKNDLVNIVKEVRDCLIEHYNCDESTYHEIYNIDGDSYEMDTFDHWIQVGRWFVKGDLTVKTNRFGDESINYLCISTYYLMDSDTDD